MASSGKYSGKCHIIYMYPRIGKANYKAAISLQVNTKATNKHEVLKVSLAGHGSAVRG